MAMEERAASKVKSFLMRPSIRLKLKIKNPLSKMLRGLKTENAENSIL